MKGIGSKEKRAREGERRGRRTMIRSYLEKKINKERVSFQLGVRVENSQLLF